MPRDGSGVYSAPPGTTATTLTSISSSSYNSFVNDLVTDANTVRPVSAGGTGAATPDAALTNLGATATGKAVLTAASPAAARTAIGAELPAGAYGLFFMATAPSGWLKANGQAVSRTTYAALFAAIGTAYGAGDGSTTFNLPDMRGEFARAWDDSRGVDAGRAIGTSQAAAMLNHTHTGTTSADGAHNHNATIASGAGATATFQTTSGTATTNSSLIAATGTHTHTVTTGDPSAGGGTETRPRNIALLACIKH